MFDIGFSELVVIGVVALIVVGPERLPKVARTAGHLFGRFQRYVGGVKADLRREFEFEELEKAHGRLKADFESAKNDLNGDLRIVEDEVNSIRGDVHDALAEPQPALPNTESQPALLKADPKPADDIQSELAFDEPPPPSAPSRVE